MSKELRIEFGSGGRKLDGWICHDIEVPIEKPLPYKDNSVTEVFASHVVEHVTPHESFAFFREVHRILKPGGKFLISVPTLEKVDDREHAADLILGHGHKMVFSKQSLCDMLWAAGFEDHLIDERKRHPVLDKHHEVIGEAKDNLESCRLVATKE